MTSSLFASARTNVHGRIEPKAEASTQKAIATTKTDPSTESLSGFATEPSKTGIKALSDVANKHGITPEGMKDIILATLQAFRPSTSLPNINLAEEEFTSKVRRKVGSDTAERVASSTTADKAYKGPTEWSNESSVGIGARLLRAMKGLFNFFFKSEPASPQSVEIIDRYPYSRPDVPRVRLRGDADFDTNKQYQPVFPQQEAKLQELRQRDATNPTGRSLRIPEVSAEQGLTAYGIAESIARKNGLDRKTLLILMYYCSIAEDYSRMAASFDHKKPDPFVQE